MLLYKTTSVGVQNGLAGAQAAPRVVLQQQGRAVAQEIGVEWVAVDCQDVTLGTPQEVVTRTSTPTYVSLFATAVAQLFSHGFVGCQQSVCHSVGFRA
jgi:hypothetical protein